MHYRNPLLKRLWQIIVPLKERSVDLANHRRFFFQFPFPIRLYWLIIRVGSSTSRSSLRVSRNGVRWPVDLGLLELALRNDYRLFVWRNSNPRILKSRRRRGGGEDISMVHTHLFSLQLEELRTLPMLLFCTYESLPRCLPPLVPKISLDTFR